MTSRLSETGIKEKEAWILYDGECPYCSNYVRFVRLKEAVGTVRLIDARDGGSEFAEAARAGFDLDEGMLFYFNGNYYHGADAIQMIAMLSNKHRFISRLNNLIFRSPRRSALLYPFLRGGRNLTLRLLGRKKIGDV